MMNASSYQDYATLCNDKNYTIFTYKNRVIRFRSPKTLEKYVKIKKWNHGYLVVKTKYSHRKHCQKEYIDLMPVLDDLYIDSDEFLSPINKVVVKYD